MACVICTPAAGLRIDTPTPQITQLSAHIFVAFTQYWVIVFGHEIGLVGMLWMASQWRFLRRLGKDVRNLGFLARNPRNQFSGKSWGRVKVVITSRGAPAEIPR